MLDDGRNNVANSLLIGSGKMGLDFTVVAPKDLWPDKELVEYARNAVKITRFNNNH